MNDNVNHPKHYTQFNGVECIEFTKHLNFSLGSAFKYVWRYAEKNGLEDLEKARWYIQRQINEPVPMPISRLDWLIGHDLLNELLAEMPEQSGQLSVLMNIWRSVFLSDSVSMVSLGELETALKGVDLLIEEELEYWEDDE